MLSCEGFLLTVGVMILLWVILMVVTNWKGYSTCPHCGELSENTDLRYYTRGYNNLCQQAAGDYGHFRYCCGKVEFEQPDDEIWLKKCPSWISLKRDENWRP